MRNTRKFLIALALTAFAGVASAVPITGFVSFSSATGATWDAVNNANAITSIAASTGIKFNANGSGVDQVVRNAGGAFAGTVGSNADFFDFQFSPLSSGTMLWKFNSAGITYSLTMNAVDLVSKGSTSILLEGTGFMSATGYTNTFGKWDFSGNNFTFSSSAAPEPAMVLLLATGLIGFGFARKARKSA